MSGQLPYLSYEEIISFTQILDIQGMEALQELIVMEESTGTYNKQQLDKIWCAVIARFTKLEQMMAAFSLS